MHEFSDRRLLLGVAGLAGVAALARMAKAGPLDPPQGPISPTGHTVQEIFDAVSATSGKVARTDSGFAEPRTPIQSLPSSGSAQYVITQPGAYYLTDNIVQQPGMVCIDIQCDDVDLDCNGFAFIGAGSTSSSCIRMSGKKGYDVYDALFRSWQGCCIDGENCDDGDISDCAFIECVCPPDSTGASGAVCKLGASCDIDDCVVRDCVGCTLQLGDNASVSSVTCVGGTGDAIRCSNGACVDDCLMVQCSGWAVTCGSQCSVCDCRVVACLGITCGAETCVYSNELSACSGGGTNGSITVQGLRCCVEDNFVSGGGGGGGGILVLTGGDGTLIDGNHLAGTDGASSGGIGAGAVMIAQGVSNCSVVRNHIRGASTTSSFMVPLSNSYGPVAIVTKGGDMSVVPGSTHPFANFIY